MTILTGNAQGILSVEQVTALIVKPLQNTNLALSPLVSTTFPMSGGKLRVPTVETDANTGWTTEGGEIAFSDAVFSEQHVPLGKLAGITALSREAAEDTNPAAAGLMGQSLVRDLSHKVDAAFFGNVAGGVAPPGLGSLPNDGVAAGTVQRVTVPAGGYANLDPFVDGQAAVQNAGGDVSAWVMSPNTLKLLRKLKVATGWNTALLDTDGPPDPAVSPTGTNGLTIEGVPVFVNRYGIPDGAVWGLDADRIILGLRDEVQLDVDKSILFSSDRVAVRVIMRLGWKFIDPATLVYIAAAGV